MTRLPSPLPGLLLLIFIFLIHPQAGSAQADEERAPEVRLEAERLEFDRQSGEALAAGSVRMERNGLVLHGDEARWDAESGDATVQGAVRIEEASGDVEADAIELNLESGAGTIRNGRVFLREGNVHLGGAEIARLGPESYRLTNGTFTTCNGERPAWKFGVDELDLTVGGYARARNVLFYLREVPVLYLPYIIYPVKTERESGLLLPRLGYSDSRGSELSLSYYHVIDRNMDATVSLDYFSDIGVGTGLEYRYYLGRDNEGEARGYHVTGIGSTSDSYALSWEHSGTLPGQTRLAADVEYVSDQDYFSDFGETAGEYNKDSVDSVVYLSRIWDRVTLGGQFKYLKDLEQDNDLTVQRLPDVRLTAVRQRVGGPLYASGEVTSGYFWRHDGVKGTRLTLRPTLGAYFTPGGAFDIATEASYLERLYQTGSEGPGSADEGTYEFNTRLSTRLGRTFALDGEQFTAMRHSLEPELTYTYRPGSDEKTLPFFDAQDRLGGENLVAFSLTNRLVARQRERGSYLEWLYLRFSQEYDVRLSRHGRGDDSDENPFLPLRLEMIARPSAKARLDLDGRYDFHRRQAADFSAEGEWENAVKDGVSGGYRYRRDELEYLFARIETERLNPVILSLEQRYDLMGGSELEKLLEVEYRAQCWSLFFTFRDRLDDTEFLVSFSLTGLDRVNRLGATRGE